MASLSGVSVASSYTSLLKLNGNTDTLVDGNGSNAIQIVDGDGTASPLYLNTDRLGIGGQPSEALDVTGNGKISGNFTVSNGILTLGTADSSSGHINAFENMSFNIDTDNDDTNRFFEFAIDGSSGAGTELMRLTEAGQLGIGATTIQQLLHLEKDDADVGIALTQSGQRSWSFGIDNSDSDRLKIGYSTTIGTNTVATFTESGQLGIGIQPATALDVSGGLNSAHSTFSGQAGRGLLIETQSTTNNDDTVVLNAQTSTGEIAFETNSTEKMRINSSTVIIGTHNSNAHRLAIESRHSTVPFGQIVAGSSDQNQAVGFQFTVRDSNGDERDKMFLTDTGLGIGTTPLSALMVQTTNALDVTTAPTGSISFGSPSATLQGAISGRQTSNTTALQLMGCGADGNTSGDMIFNVRENDNSTFATLTNSAFKFQHFSTDLVTILRNGSVGIGISDPDAYLAGARNLVLGGTSGDHGLTIRSASDSKGIIAFGDGDASSDAGYRGQIQYIHSSDKMLFITSTANRMILDANSRISLGNNDSSGATSNTIFGRLAGNAIASGAIDNVLIGNEAGNDITTGDYNVAIGSNALSKEDVGRSSIAIGASALGSQNTVSEGSVNTIGIGTNAGYYNVTGTENVYIGHNSGLGTVGQGGSNITAVGNEALKVAYGQDNVAIGKQAGLSVTSGVRNLLIGNNAGDAITTGNYVTAVGIFAGSAIDDSSADGTTLLGYSAGLNITSGGGNTAVGFEALKTISTGATSTAVGYEALELATGSGNTAVGYEAGNVISTGAENTILGGFSNPSAFNATNETVVGGGTTGQGSNTVTLGNTSVTDVYMAQDKGAKIHGATADLETNTTGGGHVLYLLNDGNSNNRTGLKIQTGAYTPSSAGDNVFATFFDGNGSALGGIQNSSNVDLPEFFEGSDERIKDNIKDTEVNALEVINSLQFREFNKKNQSKKTKIGLVAQEVLKSKIPELVGVGSNESYKEYFDEDENEMYTIGIGNMTYYLMKAVQELSAKVTELENK